MEANSAPFLIGSAVAAGTVLVILAVAHLDSLGHLGHSASEHAPFQVASERHSVRVVVRIGAIGFLFGEYGSSFYEPANPPAAGVIVFDADYRTIAERQQGLLLVVVWRVFFADVPFEFDEVIACSIYRDCFHSRCPNTALLPMSAAP